VAIYVKDNIDFQRRFDLEIKNVETIVIEINVKRSKSFLLAVYYRPPDTSQYLNENFNELLQDSLGNNINWRFQC